MRKTFAAFVAGQALQLLILILGVNITYITHTVLFCGLLGFAGTAFLGVGVILDRIELAQNQTEMDEVAPLPKEVKVTNDKVESDAPKTGPKTGSNAVIPKEEKHITIAFEGEPSPLMAATLKEATK